MFTLVHRRHLRENKKRDKKETLNPHHSQNLTRTWETVLKPTASTQASLQSSAILNTAQYWYIHQPF